MEEKKDNSYPDKSLEYISQTQTLIGQKKRELLDTQTGEVIWVDQITKRTYGTKNFWKCYLMDFLTVLGIIDSKQLDVFIYIVENTNSSTNMFIGTYTKIAQDVGVSRPTIATIMKKLQENNFIKKVQSGLWLVNPNIPISKITLNRTKRPALDENTTQESTESTVSELPAEIAEIKEREVND